MLSRAEATEPAGRSVATSTLIVSITSPRSLDRPCPLLPAAASAPTSGAQPAVAALCLHPRHCSRSITSPPETRKSISAGVDIEWWRGYGFSRSPERQQGLAETNYRQAVPAVQVVAVRRTVRRWSSEAREVAGRRRGRRPDRVARSDQGPPQRDRGHGRCGTRECSAQYPAVKSVSGTPGEGVGCGRAHREVRQWGSKPEQTQDGQRGWLPKSDAVIGRSAVRITRSTQNKQYAVPRW